METTPLSDHLDMRMEDGKVYVRANGRAADMLRAMHRTGELHALSPTDMVFIGAMWATAGLEMIHAGGGGGPVIEAVISAGKLSGGEMSRAVIEAAQKARKN